MLHLRTAAGPHNARPSTTKGLLIISQEPVLAWLMQSRFMNFFALLRVGMQETPQTSQLRYKISEASPLPAGVTYLTFVLICAL